MSLSGHLAGNWKITIETDRELDRTLPEDAMPRLLQPNREGLWISRVHRDT